MKEWDSPINLIVQKATEESDKQISNEVVAQLKYKYGIDVNIDRLLKIMQNAHSEWNRGYNAGYRNGKQERRENGHWIPVNYIPHGILYTTYRCSCSECGHSAETQYNFCPHCGADMRDYLEKMMKAIHNPAETYIDRNNV